MMQSRGYALLAPADRAISATRRKSMKRIARSSRAGERRCLPASGGLPRNSREWFTASLFDAAGVVGPPDQRAKEILLAHLSKLSERRRR